MKQSKLAAFAKIQTLKQTRTRKYDNSKKILNKPHQGVPAAKCSWAAVRAAWSRAPRWKTSTTIRARGRACRAATAPSVRSCTWARAPPSRTAPASS